MSKHAVVTGAGNGLGAAVARGLGAAGYDVTGVDLRRPALEKVMDEIAGEHGVRTRSLVGDLADEAFATDLVTMAWAQAPVDGLVNAAGIYPAIPFLEIDAAAWNHVQAVNVVAPLLATQQLARLAVPAGHTPAVVNITSGAASRARPGTSHYSTSKAALVMLTKSSAIELGPAGIRVNAVAPGFFPVASEVNPISEEYAAIMAAADVLPGGARSSDIAHAVEFLLSDKARWISGAVLPVDGATSVGTTKLPQHWAGTSDWQNTQEATA
ncbi:SDR family NAD(P)-dependent oxidoreductase [Kineosporia succinea]|uniref:NAD(P)-dependent dehydrogenase (Short-subunit alcohol dehydrogenase family) n=1 Tax=Kineosporia succinea TaxID=84632 RepID=A0ABT9PA21_9ACTN|nr:SDR family oxidoreductase [Kineosporia succinea]MDP9829540.1 NAD(P)-dependent dehydrogenase (short-subunit alcohol dehydrogenase family) [Kineosporia succinea]